MFLISLIIFITNFVDHFHFHNSKTAPSSAQFYLNVFKKVDFANLLTLLNQEGEVTHQM